MFYLDKGKFEGIITGNISGIEMLLGENKLDETIFGDSNIAFSGSIDGEDLQFESDVKISSIYTKGMTPNDLDTTIEVENDVLRVSNFQTRFC